MAPAAELARPPRIPKLTYRNPLPTAGDSSTDLTITSSESLEHLKLPVSPLTLTPPPTPKSTREFDTRSTKSAESTSLASSNGSSSRDSKASSTKKKKTGVLNFLTLKEPSQTALEQFADAQRKQNAAKSGQSIHSVPTTKLPPTVPKVNSKWDGVPQSVKSSQSSARSSKRNSTWSAASSNRYSRQPTSSPAANASVFSVATQQSRGAPNSLASPTASMFDLSERSDSLSSSSKPFPRSDSPSTSSLPEISRYSPDSFTCSGALPVHETHPWSPPPHPSETDPSLTFLTTFDDKLTITDPDLAHSTEVDALFRKLKARPSDPHAPQPGTGTDSPDPDVPDTHDFLFDVQPIPTSPPTRGPPSPSPRGPAHRAPSAPTPAAPPPPPAPRPTANFSRPRPNLPSADAPRVYIPRGPPTLDLSTGTISLSSLTTTTTNPSSMSMPPPPPLPPRHHARHHKPSAPSLPTLYEVSIASADEHDNDNASTTSSTPSVSTEIGEAAPRASTDSADSDSSFAPSIAPSVAPSVATSVTPSVMSASWYRSPQERLGLGGRLRKVDVLPWEEGAARGKAKKSRLSIFGRG